MRTTTKPRILAAAAFLFSRQGYPQTTTRAIARKARVREESIRLLFGAKDNLLAQVLEEGYVSGHDFVVLYTAFTSTRRGKSRSRRPPAFQPFLIVAQL